MINRISAIVALSLVASAASADDLNRYIAGKAAGCFAEPVALRGIAFSADVEAGFTRDGQVSAVKILSVAPQTATSSALAEDFAAAMKRCGPYVTEGMREISLKLYWPM
jgi:hypothetical protein